MNNNLKNFLRPHIARAVARGRADALRTFAAAAPGLQHSAAFAEDLDAGFTPADLPRLRDYYEHDEQGRYPGNLHAVFGVSATEFARETGLRRGGDGTWREPGY